MKFAFFGELDQEKKDFYTSTLGTNHELSFHDFCLGEQASPTLDFDAISIFVACKASKEVLEKFPNLKLIAVRSTGFDNVDLEYCKQKNIVVSTVPAYGTHTVAEYAFALILQITRKVNIATENTKNNNFDQIPTLRGFDLNEKTIGVVGTGRIGANVARIAKGFNMKILAYDMYQNAELQKELGFEYVELEKLLAESDIITLHAPSNPETHHMINKENIFKIKKGAILINTARGALAETAALLEAIKQNHLSAIGIDVLEEEEKQLHGAEPETEATKFAKELITLPNVHYSSHIAFFTKEAEHNIMETTKDNIEKFTAGTPQNDATTPPATK